MPIPALFWFDFCAFLSKSAKIGENGRFAPFCWPHGARGAKKAGFPRVLLAIQAILELHVTHFTSREKKHNKNRRLRALRPP